MTPLLVAVLLQAAPPPPPPPPPDAACFPACRTGFMCHQGQCVSACNPGCAAGETCTPTGECVPALQSDAPVARGPLVSDEGERAPRGYHWEYRRTRGLIIGGALAGGITWLISVFAAVFSYDNTTFFPDATGRVVQKEGAYLAYAVPLIGPIVGRTLLSAKYGQNLSGAVDWLFAVGSSVAQMAGLTMAVLGARQTQQLVSDDEHASRSTETSPVRWALSPGAPGAPAGFTFTLVH